MANYLVTFHTHYGATRFHKYCKRENISVKMKPTPRELSSSCGVCVQMETSRVPSPAEHEDMDSCYIIRENGVNNSFQRIHHY